MIKALRKKTFTDLGSLGNIASGGDCCGLFGGAKESDAGIAATSGFEDICYSNFIKRHIKY